MQPNERFEDWKSAVNEMIHTAMSRVWTALPAFVTPGKFDAAKQTVQLTSAVKGEQQTFDANGKPRYKPVSMPQLPDAPVHFAGGGGWVMTHPIKDKDEGMVVFSSRAIDGWWQNGGEQPRASRRRHDLSDGMFIPGLRSQPKKLVNFNNTDPEWRSEDGTVGLRMNKDAITMFFPGHSITFGKDGTIKATGEITAKSGTANSVTQTDHKHGGVTTGSGHTLKPDPGT